MDILIASSQRIEGDILKCLIDLQPEMNVSGLVFNATDLLVQAQTTATDLALVEWGLLAGTEETIQTLHLVPAPPSIIVFGRRQDWAQVALTAGSDAYFWQGHGPKALLTMTRKLWLESRYA